MGETTCPLAPLPSEGALQSIVYGICNGLDRAGVYDHVHLGDTTSDAQQVSSLSTYSAFLDLAMVRSMPTQLSLFNCPPLPPFREKVMIFHCYEIFSNTISEISF